MSDVVLTNGGFSCVGEHAVKVAHMMSCAEAAAMHGDDIHDVLTVLHGYLLGDEDEDSAIKTFHDEWPEAFPGLKR